MLNRSQLAVHASLINLKTRGWEREVSGPVRGTIGQRGPRDLCAPSAREKVRKPPGGPGGQAVEGKPRAGVAGVRAGCWGNPGQTMASLRRGYGWGEAGQGPGQ